MTSAPAPAISIVIPVYNRQQYLGLAIASVLAQTRTDFELLVWDDGSTDLSAQVARYFALQDPRVRVVKVQHQGVALSLKSAVAQTTGHYIGWVDSDDLLEQTALEQMAAVLDARPEVGLVYTDYRTIDALGQDRGLGTRCRIPYSPERLLIDFMTFHFRLIRRSVYDQVGGIDSSFERAEDYDLCLRLSEVTQVQHLPRPLYAYRLHSDSLTNDHLEMVRWSFKASSAALQRRRMNQTHRLELSAEGRFVLSRLGVSRQAQAN